MHFGPLYSLRPGFEEMISRAKSSNTSGWGTRGWGTRPRRCQSRTLVWIGTRPASCGSAVNGHRFHHSARFTAPSAPRFL